MRKSQSREIKFKSTGMRFCPLELDRLTQGAIRQDLKRSGFGDADFEFGRTQQYVTGKRFDRTAAGFITYFDRLGLGDVKQLKRTTPGNPGISLSRVVAAYRKIEFNRTVMGGLSYGAGRVAGGFRKINLSRQVAGNINYDMSCSQYGNIKQFGRVVQGTGRKFGRVSPNTIQCGRIVPNNRKLEFGRLLGWDMTHEAGRTIGGFHKLIFGRQVMGGISH